MDFPAERGEGEPVNQHQISPQPKEPGLGAGTGTGTLSLKSFLCSLEDLGEARAASKDVEDCSSDTTRSSDVMTVPTGKMQGGLGGLESRCQNVKPTT